MKISSLLTYIVFMSSVCLHANQSVAWHDATHMAVAKAAGLDNYIYLAVGADMTKEKTREREAGNHYNNTPKGVEITPEMVLAQFSDYNKPTDADGHLYGAIVASVTECLVRATGGKYALYPLGFTAHYLGDLSMPFHNIDYNYFNEINHSANDGIVEKPSGKDEAMDVKVSRIAAEIQKRMTSLPPIQLRTDIRYFYRDLATAVATIANKASKLGYAIQETIPPRTLLTEEEAYMQLAQSAQLLKVVYEATIK